MMSLIVPVVVAMLLQENPVVTSASFFEWDHDAQSASITDEYRIYLSRTPGVIPDGSPHATAAAPLLEWPIVAPPGQWHAVVTAFDADSGLESPPSEEIRFFVLEGPNNPRVR